MAKTKAKPKKHGRRKIEPGVFGPRKLADGREAWDFRFRIGDENRSITKYSLEDANQLARDYKSNYLVDDLLPDTTMGEFFANEETQKTLRRIHKLSKETRAYWRWMWSKHICHQQYGISGLPMKELGYGAPINKFLNGMTAAEVGEPMQVRVLGVVSAILDVGSAGNPPLLLANPIPKLKGKPSSNQKRNIFIPTIEMIEQLRWEVLHGGSKRYEGNRQLDALLISMFAYLAPRPEELAILPRSDAHTDHSEIEIFAPKAARGKSTVEERTAPINEVLNEDLAEWLEGEPMPKSALIIATQTKDSWPAGGYRNWRRRVFKPALERMADKLAQNKREHERICKLRPYDLRHTGLSLWLANGGKNEKDEWDGSPANVVDVADWGGHKPRTLLDFYAHKVKTAPKIPIAKQIEIAREEIEEREREAEIRQQDLIASDELEADEA